MGVQRPGAGHSHEESRCELEKCLKEGTDWPQNLGQCSAKEFYLLERLN